MAANGGEGEGTAEISSAENSLESHESVNGSSSQTVPPKRNTQANTRKTAQRRRKPTLNCTECVERKIKCNRARPSCLACTRRQAICRYSQTANVLASADWTTRPVNNHKDTGNARAKPRPSFGRPPETPAWRADLGAFPGSNHVRTSSAYNSPSQATDSHSPSASIIRQRNRNPTGRMSALSMVGVASRHPFNNYWTASGGLPEVVGVLPQKEQADLLVDRYFECVDPIYPIISEAEFRTEHERFWNLSQEEKDNYDAAQLALQYVVYACATRLIMAFSPEERVNTSNFYLSACHQCLCIHSYFNCFALTTIKTAVLICHFLISENNVFDAWTFSGMTQRQACGLELHRDPDLVCPAVTRAEQTERCKIWLSCMFQDASLSMFMSLPPTTLHYDIDSSYLYFSEDIENQLGSNFDTMENMLSPTISDTMSSAHDSHYLKSLWDYVWFLHTYICVPKSLDKPLANDTAHRDQLTDKFRAMYSSWSEPFNSYDARRFEIENKRLLRQVVSVCSSYFYVLTMLCMDKNEDTGVEWDVYGALDAAHEGMAAFFALQRLDAGQISSWGAYHTRAYAMAMMIGSILAAQTMSPREYERDLRFMLAKSDFDRYLDALTRGKGTVDYEAVQVTRIADLESLRSTITIA